MSSVSLPSIFATSYNNSVSDNKLQILPVLPTCAAQCITGNTDPKIDILLNYRPLHILVDSEAHVSVLSKTLMEELTGLSLNTDTVKSSLYEHLAAITLSYKA